MDDFETMVFVAQMIVHMEAAKERARFLGRHGDADIFVDFRAYLTRRLSRSLRAEAAEGR